MIEDDNKIIKDFTKAEYKEGFVTDVEQEYVPKGLNEDIIRTISARKQEPQWLLDFRLDAFRRWQKMTEPHWGHLDLPKIDYQDISFKRVVMIMFKACRSALSPHLHTKQSVNG